MSINNQIVQKNLTKLEENGFLLIEKALDEPTIVLHYQQNPMFPGIKFVSNPQFTLDQLGYKGTFPFVQ